LRQVGAYIDPDGSNFWGIEQFTTPGGRRLIAGSDRDFGLQIFRYTGADAAARPSCDDVLQRTTPNSPVLVPLTCTDPNGNAVHRRIVRGPVSGTVGRPANGSVLYTPNRGFSGHDSFTFVGSDGVAESALARADVTVAAPSNLVEVNLGQFRGWRYTVAVEVPGPGVLGVGLRGNLARGRVASAAKFLRLARRERRPSQAGRVRVVLRVKKGKRRALRRALNTGNGRVRARVNVSFTPNRGIKGRTTKRTILNR
jgi:hypothetical protein